MNKNPTAQTAPRFWNIAAVSEDEGEITLYGDVVSRKPTNFWTGEPVDGLFITPEGFLEDLAAVKDKSKITVKLNSCGGDLYTGIAIHNVLKALPGAVEVVVEGIAASAASVIMCAGDRVTVYPGSLVMIHGVSVVLWDALNIADIKQLLRGMEASERAVVEIYAEKTGIATDALRGMMSRETWMTGREAVSKGFADVLAEGSAPEMSLTADKKVLFVAGISHDVARLRNLPGDIPVMAGSAPTPIDTPPEDQGVNKQAAPAVREGGKPKMTLEELRTEHPEIMAQIEQEAANSARAAHDQQSAEAVAAERARLAAIDSIAASVPDPAMVHAAKYGDKPCTAQELCFRVMQSAAAAGQNFLAAYAKAGEASNANQVGAAPNGGAPVDQREIDAADMAAVLNAYKGGNV